MLIKQRNPLFPRYSLSPFIVLIFAVCLCAETNQNYVDKLASQAEKLSNQEGKEALALKYISEAIRLQPKRVELYYKRAFILGKAGQYVYAIKEFNRFVNLKEYPHAVAFRGDCFMAVGNYAQAAKDYTVFLREYPQSGKVWSYLAEAFALVGNQRAALQAIDRGLNTVARQWHGRLQSLRELILTNQRIIPHKPLSN